jgi:hypothetical protein
MKLSRREISALKEMSTFRGGYRWMPATMKSLAEKGLAMNGERGYRGEEG